MNKKNKNLNSSLFGAISSVLFIVFATIFSEINKPFKDFLTNVFSHHWIGKSILVIVFFLLTSCFFYFFIKKELNSTKLINFLVWSSYLGFFIILGSYILHFLKII